MNDAAEQIYDLVGASANVIFGAVVDPDMQAGQVAPLSHLTILQMPGPFHPPHLTTLQTPAPLHPPHPLDTAQPQNLAALIPACWRRAALALLHAACDVAWVMHPLKRVNVVSGQLASPAPAMRPVGGPTAVQHAGSGSCAFPLIDCTR